MLVFIQLISMFIPVTNKLSDSISKKMMFNSEAASTFVIFHV